jgi:hypothetical protein
LDLWITKVCRGLFANRPALIPYLCLTQQQGRAAVPKGQIFGGPGGLRLGHGGEWEEEVEGIKRGRGDQDCVLTNGREMRERPEIEGEGGGRLWRSGGGRRSDGAGTGHGRRRRVRARVRRLGPALNRRGPLGLRGVHRRT